MGFNYQDDVNTGLDREDDIEAAPEEEESDENATGIDPSENIQTAVHKVRNMFFYSRSLLKYFSFEKLSDMCVQAHNAVKIGIVKSTE